MKPANPGSPGKMAIKMERRREMGTGRRRATDGERQKQLKVLVRVSV